MRDTPLPLSGGYGLLLVMGLLASPAVAQTTLPQESIEAQQTQAELQERIDAADNATREMLRELRDAERETHRLEARNEELAPRLERQSERLTRREAALDALEGTQDALPALKRRVVERLDQWVARDLPFLVEEREARVASLEAGLSDPEASEADQWQRLLSAWRAELDYGRELDAWRGTLSGGDPGGREREVEFLRLGRVGLYYLTPDGREGGVWRADVGQWESLEEAQRREVRHGLRMARDQRAPSLLTLPVSQPLVDGEADS